VTRRVSPEACLEGLRSTDPRERREALDAISRNRVPYRAELAATLIDLLDDVTVVDEPGRASRLAAASALAAWPHTRTVPALQTRIEARGRAQSGPLLRALGALAPESTSVLLAYVDDADPRVRGMAREGLRAAVRRSRPACRLAILERVLRGLVREAEADDWLGFLTGKSPKRFKALV